MFGVGFKTGDLPPQTPPGDFLQPLNEHGMVQVGGNDASIGSHTGLDQERKIGCAGPDIKCPTFCSDRDIGSSNFLPPVVQSKAQKRVVKIVDAGDRRKHPLNSLLTGRASPG